MTPRSPAKAAPGTPRPARTTAGHGGRGRTSTPADVRSLLLSTKIHTICEGTGKPLVTTLTPGQDADTLQLPVLVGLVRINKPGPGRPRTRLDSPPGDKAYSSKTNKDLLRITRTRCTIPEREDQKANRRNRRSAGGRPVGFDRQAYRILRGDIAAQRKARYHTLLRDRGEFIDVRSGIVGLSRNAVPLYVERRSQHLRHP